jgi:hydroxymethylglutaryl-CoA synthase
MSMFEADDHHDVEGVDTFNACYGGTNAFFSTTNWIQGNAWKGGYGIVTCSDPAVHPHPAHISGIGASSISMLVTP